MLLLLLFVLHISIVLFLAASETPGSSVSKSKRSTNYASKECGAKVLASNPEAENIKAVLTSNKDEYMINPCKAAKKWYD